MTDNKIVLKRMFGRYLALRSNVEWLFSVIDNIEHPIVYIDFDDIETITWGFTQEYLKRKSTVNKVLKELNMTMNVECMFNSVKMRIFDRKK